MTDDLETRLRDHGTAWRAAHPPAPEVDEARLAGRRLPLRSLALVAAGVAVVAAGTLIAIPRNHNAARVIVGAPTGVVPWNNDPVPYVQPTATTIPRAHPVCRAADLRAGPVDGPGLATGTAYWAPPVTNIGAITCELPVAPVEISALMADGRKVGWQIEPESQSTALDLAPGQQGRLRIGAGDSCGPSQTQPSRHLHSVAAVLTDGRLLLPGLDLLVCDEAVGASRAVFAVFETERPAPEPPPPSPGTLGTLVASVEDEPVFHAGSVASFVIMLSNPTSVDVSLDPCPSFVEGFNGIETSPQSYRLNCDSVHRVPAHGQVKYQMQIAVPSQTGATKFGWQLRPDGPFAGLTQGMAEVVP